MRDGRAGLGHPPWQGGVARLRVENPKNHKPQNPMDKSWWPHSTSPPNGTVHGGNLAPTEQGFGIRV